MDRELTSEVEALRLLKRRASDTSIPMKGAVVLLRAMVHLQEEARDETRMRKLLPTN